MGRGPNAEPPGWPGVPFEDVTPARLTPRQREAVMEFAAHGDQKAAAACMSIRVQTYREHLRLAYGALGAHGILGALAAVGALRVPCGRAG